MPNFTDIIDPLGNQGSRRFYLTMVSCWAFDLICHPPTITWPDQDPESDFRDHNWRRLYIGSILDD